MNISGINISYEKIREKVSELEIFNLAFGFYPELNKFYKSPFRNDKNGRCRFIKKNDTIYFVDNAGYDGRIFFDCMECIKIMYRKDYKQALDYVYRSLYLPKPKLDIKDLKQHKDVLKIYEQFENVNEIPRVDIRFKYKEIPPINYFSQYLLTKEDLEKDKEVYFVHTYFIKGKHDSDFRINPYVSPYIDEVYAFHFKDTNTTKLYFSNNPKTFKFYTNCTNQDIFGWYMIEEYANNYDYLIITEGKKDQLVSRFVGELPTIGLQNAGIHIPHDKLEFIKRNFKNIFYIGDNDDAGINTGIMYKDMYGFIPKTIPECNDIALLAKNLNSGIKFRNRMKEILW